MLVQWTSIQAVINVCIYGPLTCVRPHATGEVGFLSDNRRMNVAVTRARRHCALVCDSETVSKAPFLARLVQYFEKHGEYSSAEELVPS